MTNSSHNNGLVVLAGAGPGRASLASAATLNWLRRAQVVIHDKLIDRSLLSACHADTEIIDVGKSASKHTLPQEQINRLLVDKCNENKIVVRLKGGDPFIFGRGGEEALALTQADCPYVVLPGITAAAAAGAYAGIPLTDRRLASTVTFVTGHEDPTKDTSTINYDALGRLGTLVFYMGVGNLPQIASKLIASGKDPQTPTAVVANAAATNQQTITATLATIADAASAAAIAPPAIVIVGDVVSLREQLQWYEKQKLFGQTVIVTRTRTQASALSQRLEQLGASVIEAPTIEIAPPADYNDVDDALSRLQSYAWIVFTSANGVLAFVGRCKTLGLDARAISQCKIAAIGPATAAELDASFIHANLTADEFTTQQLANELAAQDIAGKRILLARADIGSPELPQTLESAGADVNDVAFYRTTQPETLAQPAIDALAAGAVDWITFTSSSTVTNFLKMTESLDIDLSAAASGSGAASALKLAAIGPVTGDTLRAAGLTPTVQADPYTIDALVNAISNSQG